MAQDPTDYPEDATGDGVTTSPVADQAELVPAKLPPMANDEEDSQTLVQARAKAWVAEQQKREEMAEGWGLTPDTVQTMPVNQSEIEAKPLAPMGEAEAKPVAAQPFGSAFAAARKAGADKFMWRGKSYSTAVRTGPKIAKAATSRPENAAATPAPAKQEGAAKTAEPAKQAQPARQKPNFFPGNSPDAGAKIYEGVGPKNGFGSSGKLVKMPGNANSVAEAMAQSRYKGEPS